MWGPYSETRVQSVTNNAGCQLKFEYDGAQSTTLTKASVLNRTSAYCDPTADTCAAVASAPSATYTWSTIGTYEIPVLTVTDAGGRQTRWTMGAHAQFPGSLSSPAGPGALKSVMASADDTVVTFADAFVWGAISQVVVTSVTWRGMTWNYSIVANLGQLPILKVTDPNSNTRQLEWEPFKSQILSDTDELGRKTTYQYDSFGRRTRTAFPAGNYVQVTYDGRGNVTNFPGVVAYTINNPSLLEQFERAIEKNNGRIPGLPWSLPPIPVIP